MVNKTLFFFCKGAVRWFDFPSTLVMFTVKTFHSILLRIVISFTDLTILFSSDRNRSLILKQCFNFIFDIRPCVPTMRFLSKEKMVSCDCTLKNCVFVWLCLSFICKAILWYSINWLLWYHKYWKFIGIVLLKREWRGDFKIKFFKLSN